MEYKEMLNILSPCGLDCSRCLGYKKGPVRKHALELHSLLTGFEQHAERFSSFIPAFKNYSSFNEIIEIITGADCAGCRDNEAKYQLCSIANCHKDKDIDFCFQCTEYPCDPEGIDEYLHKRWLEMNDKMKEVGVEKYYEEIIDVPRYQ